MTEPTLRALYQASRPTVELDADAVLAALTGGPAEARDAGLEQLAAHPAGPALARVIDGLDADQRQLADAIVAQRRPLPRRGRWPAIVALAAGLGAAAVLVVGLRPTPAPAPVAEQPLHDAAPAASQRILMASFESAPASSAPAEQGTIFDGGFDS